MKRIHTFISVPTPDQFQFYLQTGRIILLVSVLFLPFTYWQIEATKPNPVVIYFGGAIMVYALTVFTLSFVNSFVKEYIYFFLLGLFYLLMGELAIQVGASNFYAQAVYTFITISMFLCIFFHLRMQLITFQLFCLFLFILAIVLPPSKPDATHSSYLASFIVFHVLFYLAMSFRIERGVGLRRQYSQYRHLFEKLHDGIMYVNDSGNIELVNERLARITGYREKELIGMKVGELFVESTLFFSQKNKKKRGKKAETLLKHKDQRESWINLKSIPMFSSKGKMYGHIAICSDISKRKDAEINLRKYSDRLTATNKELEQFSNFASHDLKAPIHTIADISQFLYKKYPEGSILNDKAENSVNLIAGNTERINKLVDALLVYSSSGVEKIHKVTFNMYEAVKGAMDNLASYIQRSDAHIEVDPMPQVFGDKIQLTRLIQNLIENAILYRKEDNPFIHISAEYDEKTGHNIFMIKDNGIGIDEKSQGNIFLMFQKHNTSEFSGLGIGLAICKKIVENHEGEIWVESHADEGTTIYFSMPRSQKVSQ